MRVLRAKHVRKYLRFYRLIFGIEPPYHVILDGNFIYTAIKYKLDIMHRLQSLLQESTINTYILQSAIDELRDVGSKAQSALEWATNCCSIIDDKDINKLNLGERLVELLVKQKGKKKYFIATQDKDIRQAVGNLAGVPTLYFNKVTLVLESPSEASKNFNNQIEEYKSSTLLATELELSDISTLPRTQEKKRHHEDEASHERRKRKATAPNPLSNMSSQANSSNSEKAKRSKFRHG